MNLNLEKKFSLYAKFKRYIDAESLFLSEFEKSRDPALVVYYVENFLIPRNKPADAFDILNEVIGTATDAGVREKIDELMVEVEVLKNKPTLMASMYAPEFMAFRDFVLYFIISSEKESLNLDFIEIDSYSVAKSLCHDQNIDLPYKSWNEFRSKAAREVYNFSFENKIDFSGYESVFPQEVSEHLQKIISGKNLLFFVLLLGDFQEIGSGSLVGKITNAHGRMLQVYEAGYFPCGVRDDGKIMALHWVSEV